MRGTYFNTYKMSYEVCSWVVGGVEDADGGFQGSEVCDYVVG